MFIDKGEEFVLLTDSISQPLGFSLPPHTNKIDGQSSADDPKADGALDWSLPEGDDDKEEAG